MLLNANFMPFCRVVSRDGDEGAAVIMERYFLSCGHGYLKRSPEAFRSVLDASGFDASGFVLIDDRELNTRSGAEAGIESVLFQSWPETLVSPELAALSQLSSQKEAFL